MNTKEIITKVENLLYETKGDFEKACNLLSTVKLTQDDIKNCLMERIKEYNSLVEKISWSCGITMGGAHNANAESFNEVFKLGSKELALVIASGKLFDKELFKKYRNEEMIYSEGEGVQFIREMRVLNELFVTSLIRKADETHHFTAEESERLRKYIAANCKGMSSAILYDDEYMGVLSKLIKNTSLTVKQMFELDHRMVVYTSALLDLERAGKLKIEELHREEAYEKLEQLVCEHYKAASNTPIPLMDVPSPKVSDIDVPSFKVTEESHAPTK